MNPKQRLLKYHEQLDTMRHDLFTMYKEATVPKNKELVMEIQLEVMQAGYKIERILGIKKGEEGKQK